MCEIRSVGIGRYVAHSVHKCFKMTTDYLIIYLHGIKVETTGTTTYWDKLIDTILGRWSIVDPQLRSPSGVLTFNTGCLS